MAVDRDYYADLELPPTADVLEIKKQFRKLALKYHPDRNPGREAEVNAKFQEIQSAHEVLGDPTSKAQYDATRPTSRYPAASGVRGNPWANAGTNFPPPPRRNAGGSRRNAPPQPSSGSSASGAQRWQTRFATGHAPTAKQHHAEKEAEVKKNAARAFENMRRNQAPPPPPPRQQPQPPPPPPRPEPRTESARQKREASFGNRRTGYQPNVTSGDDEPAASRHSYYSSAGANRPAESPTTPQKMRPQNMADPLSQFRDPASPADPRLRTPYSSHGGEKTNPFDEGGLNRAKSAREPPQPEMPSTGTGEPSADQQKHRSSSVPRPEGDRLGEDLRSQKEPQRPKTSETAAGHAQSSFKNRSDDQFATHESGTTAESRGQTHSTYGTPPKKTKLVRSTSSPYAMSLSSYYVTSPESKQSCQGTPYLAAHKRTPTASSGADFKPISPTLYYKQQHQIIEGLIKNSEARQSGSPGSHVTNAQLHPTHQESKHLTESYSYAVPDHGNDAYPDSARFTRESTEDINTSFVEDESQAYTFSAGGERPRAQPKSRKPKAAETSSKPEPEQQTHSEPRPTGESQAEGAFNPSGWSDQFGPHTFVPPREQTASASPTRTNRKNSRKARAAKLAAGTAASAAILIEDSSDDDAFTWQGRKTQASGPVDSPQAMDIDSPPPQTAEKPPPVPPVPDQEVRHTARNVHLEPSRPEWRQGDASPTRSPERPPKVPLSGHQRVPSGPHGSEDTPEFRATLDDLKNVAPFANQQEGLKSFGDLKDSLPFESKASSKAPNSFPSEYYPLQFPKVPVAPVPPPTLALSNLPPTAPAWNKYLEEFKFYLQEWDKFNEQLTQHFRTRERNTRTERQGDGYGFLGARGDEKVVEYFLAVRQDNDLRRKWNAAWEEHEARFREFLAFRDKMKQAQ